MRAAPHLSQRNALQPEEPLLKCACGVPSEAYCSDISEQNYTMKNVSFAALLLVGCVVCLPTLSAVFDKVLSDNTYTHILGVPFVSLALLYPVFKVNSEETEKGRTTSFLLMFFAAVSAASLIYVDAIGEFDGLQSLRMVAFVTFVIYAFSLVFGSGMVNRHIFALLFLYFMVPLPGWMAGGIIGFLQHASADATNAFFALLGIPFAREGVIFHLPSVSIEMAEECSGIRSSIALFVTGVLAAHLFLATLSGKLVLVLFVVPVAVLKNAVRVVTLSLLGAYVDIRWLTESVLHRRGGIVFFALACLLLGLALLAIRKVEKYAARPKGPSMMVDVIRHG